MFIFFDIFSIIKTYWRYLKCDIFVAPSRYESFGIVFVEAMKFSKPVIGTNVGGIPDIVLSNKNGYLIEPESVEALVNAVIKLAGSFELRKEMGREGTEEERRSSEEEGGAKGRRHGCWKH